MTSLGSKAFRLGSASHRAAVVAQRIECQLQAGSRGFESLLSHVTCLCTCPLAFDHRLGRAVADSPLESGQVTPDRRNDGRGELGNSALDMAFRVHVGAVHCSRAAGRHDSDMKTYPDVALNDKCPWLHPYIPENTYRDGKGWRSCKHCNRARQRAFKQHLTLAEYYQRYPKQMQFGI